MVLTSPGPVNSIRMLALGHGGNEMNTVTALLISAFHKFSVTPDERNFDMGHIVTSELEKMCCSFYRKPPIIQSYRIRYSCIVTTSDGSI